MKANRTLRTLNIFHIGFEVALRLKALNARP